MKKIVLILLLVAVPNLGNSQTLVSYNKTDNVDFTKFKTYQVYELDVKSIPEFEPKKEGLNLFIGEVFKQMNSRGYQKVKENPDLLINLGVTLSREKQTRETSIQEAPRYMGSRNYHWESEEIVVRNYVSGTVTLDIVDNHKNEMIWQAVAKGVVEKKQEKNKKKIVKVTEKLFKKYPVKAIK